MASGLEGRYSAKTIMWVEALAQCIKRYIMVQFSMCAMLRGYFCYYHMNAVACKAILWTRQAMLILPEFLNLLMSVDRLLAIKHPIWYKDNCTLIKAWIPIMPLVLGIFTMTSYRIKTAVMMGMRGCIPQANVMDVVSVFLGLPATVAIGIMTTLLLMELRKRTPHATTSTTQRTGQSVQSGDSKQSQSGAQREITKALTLNCILFVIFSSIEYTIYTIIFNLSMVTQKDTVLMFSAMANISGAVGISLRGNENINHLTQCQLKS
ncbi:uncharacterized protein LOC142343343 [Convolutriloba macropyga]|uniref:uncharacterized protein LOC142343343 n=1 Tax=Convolutriloba macropyga TaxID=536237 RepID=UPI003F5206C2